MGRLARRDGRAVTSYDRVSAIRYAEVESRPDSFSLRLAPRLVSLFARESRTAAPFPSVLDIGAGTGQLTDALRAAGFRTLGVDPSLPMLEQRVSSRSATTGVVVAAGGAALPLVTRFDLITATFNVLNHLPDREGVEGLIREVARLLEPGGLFVFDINTRLGLQAVSELTVHHVGPTDLTTWRRQWVDDTTLRLDATGAFCRGDTWHRYDETIEKIVLSTSWLEDRCANGGLGTLSWRADDLVNMLDDPEEHAVVFGVARKPGPDLSAE